MQEKSTMQPAVPHDLILESRTRLTVTGVQKVPTAMQKALPSKPARARCILPERS